MEDVALSIYYFWFLVQFPFIDKYRYPYPGVCNLLEYMLSRITPLIPVPIVVE